MRGEECHRDDLSFHYGVMETGGILPGETEENRRPLFIMAKSLLKPACCTTEPLVLFEMHFLVPFSYVQ